MNDTLFPSELNDSLVKFSSLLVIEATQLLRSEKNISIHTYLIINKDICCTSFQPNICLDGQLSWCQHGLLKLYFLFLSKRTSVFVALTNSPSYGVVQKRVQSLKLKTWVFFAAHTVCISRACILCCVRLCFKSSKS